MATHRIQTHRFTRDLVLVLLVLSVAVIGPVVYLSLQAREDISQKFIYDAANRAVGEFQSMAESMIRILEMIRGWGMAGKVSLNDTSGLNGLLFPVLRRDRMLFGISVADANGGSYYLTANGDGWRTSEIQTSDAARHYVQRFWNPKQKLVSEKKIATDYDPRQRPWFLPALSGKDVFWTEPYQFYSREDVGITASVATGQDSDTNRLVVALDILLDDLFREIHRMVPSENSRILIFRRDAHLYIPESGDSHPVFKSMNEIQNQLIQKIYAAWMGEHKNAGEAFSIRHDDGKWWCGFRPLERANRNIWVGVMVPEADIIGDVNKRQSKLWMVGATVVLLVGVFAFWMTRRYGRSIDDRADLFDRKTPQESIRRLISIGEGRAVEFKSTMRMNLHTQKPGKEIEMAWLKAVAAFMNTDGGTLLLGVADNGNVEGLERDGFENEDKCKLHFKNLINQHIGAELSKYLRFSLVKVDEKMVGVVVCNRSVEPVFLKTPKSEAFYIRSGPSSDALPVSKVLQYIKHRK